MTQRERARSGSAFQVPLDIYVGQNVVRRHLLDFYEEAERRGLLAQGEEVLAIFDCLLLDRKGRRGNLTLHDYAIFTNQNLITWARGTTRQAVDKFPWANVTVDKFGRRSSMEGAVKFTFKVRQPSTRRKISVRSGGQDAKAEGKSGVASGLAGEQRATELVLYLELMPLEDVPACVNMMRYLKQHRSRGTLIADFRTEFGPEIKESGQRLTQINNLARPFYTRQKNGVYLESEGAGDESFIGSLLARSIPFRARLLSAEEKIAPAGPAGLAWAIQERGRAGTPLPVRVLGKEALSPYSLSRFSSGEWLDLSGFTKGLETASEFTALLAELLEITATDEESRRIVLNRLERAISRSALAKNRVVRKAIWPLLKPVANALGLLPKPEPQVRQRVKIRPSAPPRNGAGPEPPLD